MVMAFEYFRINQIDRVISSPTIQKMFDAFLKILFFFWLIIHFSSFVSQCVILFHISVELY